MAPVSTSQILLSPAELSYLHGSLSLVPPIRPDGRTPSQFRPLIAESDVLPGANGSARVCFSDGSEAIVGVKAEVEKSEWKAGKGLDVPGGEDVDMEDGDDAGKGENDWVELTIEIPGCRDDDALPVFLAQMLTEALLANGKLGDRLWINGRFHWKLYIDILLLSPPSSYPLPLLSLTTHLALLSTRLPKLISQGDEDPLFSDDWDASVFLYPVDTKSSRGNNNRIDRPPITLLVTAVGTNILFDPSKEEIAVAEAVLAVSVGQTAEDNSKSGLKILSIRSIDPPSRLTPQGIPNALNPVTGGTAPASTQEATALRESMETQGVWTPPRGGIKRGLIGKIAQVVLEEGGVASEVLEALKDAKT